MQRKAGTISTSIGLQFNIDKPDPESITLDDISLSLSRIPRFAGKTNPKLYAYTVAQHSVFVATLVAKAGGTRADIGCALLHDAAEAYVMDMPSPIKSRMAGYKEIEDRVQRVINAKYGVPHKVAGGIVEQMDRVAVRCEQRDLMPDCFWYDRNFLDLANIPTVRPQSQQTALVQYRNILGYHFKGAI